MIPQNFNPITFAENQLQSLTPGTSQYIQLQADIAAMKASPDIAALSDIGVFGIDKEQALIASASHKIIQSLNNYANEHK